MHTEGSLSAGMKKNNRLWIRTGSPIIFDLPQRYRAQYWSLSSRCLPMTLVCSFVLLIPVLELECKFISDLVKIAERAKLCLTNPGIRAEIQVYF